MANEALAWPDPPALTDNADGSQSYQMGVAFDVDAAQSCTGVQWRVPDTVSAPSGGVHAVGLFNDTTDDRLAYKEFTPIPGGYQDVLFDTPVALSSGITYTAAVYTLHYVFRSANPAGVTTLSGSATAIEGRLEGDNGGASTADSPTNPTTSTFYVSPLIAATEADAVAPDSLAIPLSLGAPTVSQSFIVAPASLSLPVSLGAPTLTQSFAVAPASLSLPISLGAPTVATAFEGTVAPDPISLPVTFGEPRLVFIAPTGGSWETLRGIVAEARADHSRNQQRIANPIDCPVHGWPLQHGPNGLLHCQFGGHTVRRGG